MKQDITEIYIDNKLVEKRIYPEDDSLPLELITYNEKGEMKEHFILGVEEKLIVEANGNQIN